MPTLPALEVTTAQASIIMEVWGAMDPTRTPQQNFLRWQRQQMITEVIRYRRAEVDAAYEAEAQRLSDKRTALIETWASKLEDPADPYEPPVASDEPTG